MNGKSLAKLGVCVCVCVCEVKMLFAIDWMSERKSFCVINYRFLYRLLPVLFIAWMTGLILHASSIRKCRFKASVRANAFVQLRQE